MRPWLLGSRMQCLSMQTSCRAANLCSHLPVLLRYMPSMSQEQKRNPLLSPLLAPDHSGLAPAFVLTAEVWASHVTWMLRKIQMWPLTCADDSLSINAHVVRISHVQVDGLRDEGKAYADKLEAAGVKTQYKCYKG